VVVVLIAAVLIVPRLIDWNAYKPEIAAAVRDATGREFHIDGNLDIKLIPGAEFAASGVRLANVAGAKAPQMVKVASVEGKIALLPLIGGTLVVDRLIVREPEVNLQVDAAGRPNWDMKPAQPDGAAREPVPPEKPGKPPFDEVRLGDVRIEGGRFTYSDAVSGQDVTGRDLNVAVTMPELSKPLVAKTALVLNEEPTTLDVSVDTPRAVMSGKPATVAVALQTKRIVFRLDGKAAEGAAGFAGVADLDIPSVGQLAQWLDAPLERGQADPGPLKLHAEFDARDNGVTLKTATIQGSGLQATASGAVETAGGELRKAVFKLDGGVLDVDRYLPKPAAPPAAAPPPPPRADRPAPPPRDGGDPLAMLSDKPFDLKPLRGKDIDVRINLQGIKAAGFEVGRIDLAALMSGGKLDATIREIALYGGRITGQSKLDAAGDALAVDTTLTIDKVNLGNLAKAAMPPGEEPPVAGAVTAKLTAAGRGANPRALAQGLVGNLDLDLSGADMRNTGAPISAVKANIDLPGIDKQPTVKASAVFNGQTVTVDITGDTTRKLLTGDSFQLAASIGAPLAKATYQGAVMRKPTPGLDGKLDIAVTSVGRLMSWVGTPLAPNQPDPGPLTVSAVMAGDGGKATLREARIEGKAIKATAKGSFDATKAVPEFDALIDVQQADLNAYLPPEAKEPPKTPAPQAQRPPQGQQPTGWSEEPIDVAFLNEAKGKVEAKFAAIRYRDLVIESGSANATLADRAFKAALQDVKLAQGSIGGTASLAAADEGLALDYSATIAGIQAQPLLVAFAGTDRLSGTMEFTAKGRAAGRTQKELVGALNGDGSFKFLNGAIHGVNLAAMLRQAKTLSLDSSARETQKTDFAELSGTFTIRDGVLENKDLKMLAPLIRLAGTGQVPMPPRTLDYGVTATLVSTLEGQGGKDGINGLPIPIKVKGSWDAPSYDVDWQAVFREAAKDPERLKSMPRDLQNAAKGLGVDLPGIPGGDALPDVLRNVPGIPGLPGATPATPPAGAPGTGTAAPPDPARQLRNLFGR